ncbi:hypothetical protein BGX20_008604 [Mortierella sp. AD010]|nr:hypothetical protein BGX20_008604 [Mortierella sp. AD010]
MKFIATATLLALSSVALLADAHISFRYPCPRLGPYSECPQPGDNQWDMVDYDVQSPLGTHDQITDPICKHSASFPGVRPVFQAGQTVSTKMDVDVNHNGGSAPASSTYTVPLTIPANAPSGPAVLNWIWNNNEGNRELYSSCADVVIQGTNGGSLSGVAPLFANYGPSSPLIPERSTYGGNWGKQYFDARPSITITVPAQKRKRQFSSRK